MALITRDTTCALCDELLGTHRPIVATTHFIGDETDPLWRFSDAAMHYSCFQKWEHREEFVRKYNSVMRRIWADGTHMRSDGIVEKLGDTGYTP